MGSSPRAVKVGEFRLRLGFNGDFHFPSFCCFTTNTRKSDVNFFKSRSNLHPAHCVAVLGRPLKPLMPAGGPRAACGGRGVGGWWGQPAHSGRGRARRPGARPAAPGGRVGGAEAIRKPVSGALRKSAVTRAGTTPVVTRQTRDGTGIQPVM